MQKFKVELISITPDAEKVIELAGRTSYQSQNRITTDSAAKFIKNIIKMGHLSVLEHAGATFKINGVSRSLTHQLVRHRMASFTQQSQRYVDETSCDFIIPESIQNNPRALVLYNKFMGEAKDTYLQLRKMNILKEDARYVLPNATATEIILTANFREFRHIFKLRCDMHAQLEIRKVALEMLKQLKEKTPSIFEDFIINKEKNVATTNYFE